MKKLLSVVAIATFSAILISSCGSPYKKRKRCRGNGSWYGNRNLGATQPQKAKTPTVYVLNTKEDIVTAH